MGTGNDILEVHGLLLGGLLESAPNLDMVQDEDKFIHSLN